MCSHGQGMLVQEIHFKFKVSLLYVAHLCPWKQPLRKQSHYKVHLAAAEQLLN